MSFKTAVRIKGESRWTYNGLFFATSEEAEAWGRDVSRRWSLLEKWEVQTSNEPVNYKYENGQLIKVE
jgi:hypothetical protein